MKQIDLEQLIQQVLDKQKQLGLKESTIISYRFSAYNQISKFFKTSGIKHYSSETIAIFQEQIIEKLKKNKISERHFRKLRRACEMLDGLYKHGNIQWKYLHHNRYKYHISDFYQEYIEMFVQQLNVNNSTIPNIVSVLREFCYFLENSGHSNFCNLGKDDLKRFLVGASENHKKSMGNVIYALRKFLNFLEEFGILSFEYESLLQKPARTRKKALSYFSHEEVNRILAQIDTTTAIGKRDFAVIQLAVSTGLRSIDIACLKLSDISWEKKEIYVVQRKTSRSIVIPMDVATGNVLANYILYGRVGNADNFVFHRHVVPYEKLSTQSSIRNALEKYLKAAGIPRNGRSFHALRRTMGTWLLQAEIPLSTISQILGHKDMSSAKQYLSIDYTNLAHCALDFIDIPIKSEVYI